MAAISLAKKFALAKAMKFLDSESGQTLAKNVAPLIIARVVGRSAIGRVALRAGFGGIIVPLLVPVAASVLKSAVARRALRAAR